MTAIEKQQEFYTKLKNLLKEYKAEISLEETSINYYTETKIVVDFEYDEFMAEQFGSGIIPTLDLGKYERGT